MIEIYFYNVKTLDILQNYSKHFCIQTNNKKAMSSQRSRRKVTIPFFFWGIEDEENSRVVEVTPGTTVEHFINLYVLPTLLEEFSIEGDDLEIAIKTDYSGELDMDDDIVTISSTKEEDHFDGLMVDVFKRVTFIFEDREDTDEIVTYQSIFEGLEQSIDQEFRQFDSLENMQFRYVGEDGRKHFCNPNEPLANTFGNIPADIWIRNIRRGNLTKHYY